MAHLPLRRASGPRPVDIWIAIERVGGLEKAGLACECLRMFRMRPSWLGRRDPVAQAKHAPIRLDCGGPLLERPLEAFQADDRSAMSFDGRELPIPVRAAEVTTDDQPIGFNPLHRFTLPQGTDDVHVAVEHRSIPARSAARNAAWLWDARPPSTGVANLTPLARVLQYMALPTRRQPPPDPRPAGHFFRQ